MIYKVLERIDVKSGKVMAVLENFGDNKLSMSKSIANLLYTD